MTVKTTTCTATINKKTGKVRIFFFFFFCILYKSHLSEENVVSRYYDTISIRYVLWL